MTETPSVEERVRTNYNEVGIAVMEAMYSDDYLSIGGTESTAALAELVGIEASSLVLDVGCGVGGPALHLSASVGCIVTGLDLVETSIAEAKRRAEERGLGKLASFEVGDATALPFADESFDFVVGQDAWCHVPDKVALIDECARVLRPGGTIAFTDWLAGTGMSGAERAAALDAAVSRDAASVEQYLRLLQGAGFVAIDHADTSDTYVEQYREIYDRLRKSRPAIVEQFGERVYVIVADINATILHGFEGAALCGGRFTASKGQ